MPAQEPILSFPSPASLDTLSEHFFDGCEHRTSTPGVSYTPSLHRSGGTTTKGNPSIAFDSSVVLPPYAEPPLVIDHEGAGVSDQSQRSESFVLASPPSIGAVNGGGGSDHIDAHARWTYFAALDRGSQRRTLTHSAHLNSSKVKSKGKSSFSWPSLATRLLYKCKSSPRMVICKSMAIWSRDKLK